MPRPRSHFLDSIPKGQPQMSSQICWHAFSCKGQNSPQSSSKYNSAARRCHKKRVLSSLYFPSSLASCWPPSQSCISTRDVWSPSGLLMNVVFSLQNVFSKKVMRDSKIHGLQLPYILDCPAAFSLIHRGFWWIHGFPYQLQIDLCLPVAQNVPTPGCEQLQCMHAQLLSRVQL